jgi:hypothetical protein
VSTKFTPSSTARCRTRLACPRSLGLPQAESPHRRIAPKPNRLTVKSPRPIVPATAAPLFGDCSTRNSISSKPQRTCSAFSETVYLWHFSEVSVSVRKLLRATLIVKRATSITGELWAAFTAAGAASTLAEIAISRVRSPKQLRGVECGLAEANVSSCTKQTCRPASPMSVAGGRPKVAVVRSNRR